MYLQFPKLGAYPDDPYFDPKRPGWLPYWIDTPTESEAKYAWLYRVKPEAITRPAQVYPTESLKTPPTPQAPPPGTVYKETIGVTPDGGYWTPQGTIDPVAFQRWWQTRQLGPPGDRNGNGNGDGMSPWLLVALVVGGVAAVKAIRG